MKKFCLLALFCSVVFAVKAQNTAAPGLEQTHSQFSVNLAVLGNSNRSVAENLYEEGERYERFGDFDSAAFMFNKAANEFKQDKKYNLYGTTLIRLSNVYLSQANFAEAEHVVLKQVLRNYAKTGSKVGQMSAYQQLGKIYLAANKLPQALWFYTQHGILAQQLQDKNAFIESVLGIASVKIKKKDYLLASKDLNTAELLSKNANTIQYNQIIKNNRALIAEKTVSKKG